MENLIPIWAGVECTVNRVGSVYFHQCRKNGHDQRLQDLQRFAKLGIERIRYPFLWELAATAQGSWDWSWADTRAQELKRLKLKPIAGLIHHGSGPPHTHLLDPDFPEKLADYAEAFAHRYPWIEDYTPVNEPLTTARFSCLYGHWYPHDRSDRSFVRALFHEIKATILAMKAIRKINHQARLIQTEDLGRTQGTPTLDSQIHFENCRRWLSFDMLCGMLTDSHPLNSYLLQNGLKEKEMLWLRENSCPPDIVGINHYPLSNRFLDHRLQFYPEEFHGGNGCERYADVGAIDTTAAPLISLRHLLKEVWNRYHQPIAITEMHVQGPRETQLRWFQEVTTAAQQARDKDGIDMNAITAWSLLGSFDWKNLCTKDERSYESGVFDIRGPEPRPTALAQTIRSWSQGKRWTHPVLEDEGWWVHRDRVSYGPRLPHRPILLKARRPLLITGAHGTLGRAFARVCEHRHLRYKALSRREMEISRFESVQKAIEDIQPWAVINTAGYVRVDEAEYERERCFRENVEGPKNLALMCAQMSIPLLHFSSDLVFNGSVEVPYTESSDVSPLNVYGETKVASEQSVLALHPQSLVVRTSSFFSPWDTYNFVFSVLQAMIKGHDFHAASDITISPTYVPDLVEICLDLLIDGESGLLHLTNQGQLTWADLAQRTAEMAMERNYISHHRWSREKICARPSHELNFTAKRPNYSALTSERVRILPSYEKALDQYFGHMDFDRFLQTQTRGQEASR